MVSLMYKRLLKFMRRFTIGQTMTAKEFKYKIVEYLAGSKLQHDRYLKFAVYFEFIKKEGKIVTVLKTG